ncbi:MAG: aspartate/glutamate racemase family protein [Bifidobacteriaceae bacterium]|jgi:glutamate racemase|nr:aspartate/glutamate racemase family protein [Bifidobacteriaceae bacterium]
MSQAVGLVHTVPGLVAELDELTAQALPEARRVHVADPALLRRALDEGVTAWVVDQVTAHVRHLARIGVGAVLLTCSSIGEAAAPAGRALGLPVSRIDTPMVNAAVGLALAPGARGRVGLLATLASTVAPTRRLIHLAASRRTAPAGGEVRVTARVVEGADAARRAGRTDQADRLVAAAAGQLGAEVDVVVLAQASMAGAAELPGGPAPLLASPASGIAAFAAMVHELWANGRPSGGPS